MHPKVSKLLTQEQYQQRTPEWYEVREGMLTASDVAAALDIKPYESYRGSPRKELLKKKLEKTPFSNMFTAHGNEYEDVARRKFEDATGESVLEFGLLVHPEHKWLGASPDGVTVSGKVVEIKCPISRPIIAGEVPHHYFPQVQIVMEVCDLEETVFIQYKPSTITWPLDEEFDVTVVKRDRDWFQRVLPELKSFFDEFQMAKESFVPEPKRTSPDRDGKRVRVKPVIGHSQCFIVDDLYGSLDCALEKCTQSNRASDANAFSFVDDD